MKKVVFASDHAGFALKNALVPLVRALGYEVEDVGADAYEEGDDYPDYVAKAAREVSEHPESVCAVVLGGSGQGEAIVANRFPHVRAVVFNGPASAKAAAGEQREDDVIRLSRQHNDANVLSLGARFLNEEEAKQAVQDWLSTPFPGDERHLRRIRKIERHP